MNEPTITETDGAPDHLHLVAVLPNLSAAEAFDHFIRPELVSRWWAPVSTVELVPGGAYKLEWPAQNWTLDGKILAFEPGKYLRYLWRWLHDPDAPDRFVEIRFTSPGAASVLDLTHGPYDASARDRETRQNHLDGWLHFLTVLGHVEKSEAP